MFQVQERQGDFHSDELERRLEIGIGGQILKEPCHILPQCLIILEYSDKFRGIQV